MYRVPLCVPYWDKRTFRAIFSRMLTAQVATGNDVLKLEKRLSALFGTPGILLFNSGRAAIEVALRALGIDAKDEVIVPTFCCLGVVTPVLAAGAQPVFADVDNTLSITPETIDAVMSPRTRAVIVPHLFGSPVNINEICDLCNSRGIHVIDDAAQALGVRLRGRLLGTHGEAGILSFGKGKVCFGTGGGALITNNHHLLEQARSIQASSTSPTHAGQQALSVLFWRRWRRWTLPLRVMLSRIGLISDPMPDPSVSTISNLDAAVASTLLDTLEENIALRQARALRYRDRFEDCRTIRLIAHSADSACLAQVAQITGGDQTEGSVATILNQLIRGGYEVSRSYKPLHLLPQFQSYSKGSLPVATRMWNTLMELPCEPSVALKDVDRISSIVRKALPQN